MRRSDSATGTVRQGVSLGSGTGARIATAVLSGVALGLAFPKFDLSLLAWVAFIPLLMVVDGESIRRVFGYAWLQGWACYLVSMYWVSYTLNHFAGVNWIVACVPMMLLAAVMALYTGLALGAAEFVARRIAVPLFVTLPIAWVAAEWLRSFFPVGFPWNLLGYAAWRDLGLIQFAEITGVYGVSALIMFFNAVVFTVLFTRHSRRIQTWSLSALTVLMVAALGFGTARMKMLERESPAGRLRVAMVQGDIPQSIKWDPAFLDSSFNIYMSQTEAAVKSKVDLVIWPEAAAAFFFQPDNNYPPRFIGDMAYRDRLLEMARETHVPVLLGAPALGVSDGRLGIYNRAYMVSDKGQIAGHYDKIQLVPFGEYVPFRPILGFFVDKIVHGFGDLIPGTAQTLFDVKGARLGVLICYESVFPDLTRREVDKGADVLVNITNDAWYGKSSAPYQLLAMAAMRSVETKVPMVRVANTGISAVIAPDGRITAPTPLFKRGTEIEDVKWRPRCTVYTAVGDLFAEACFMLIVAGLIVGAIRPAAAPPDRSPSLLSRNGRS